MDEPVSDAPTFSRPLKVSRESLGKREAQYSLFEKLGQGGAGVVYRAFDSRLRRNVALKFLNESAPRQFGYEQFLHEARAAAALDHPNICAVYDVGEIYGKPYIASAFIAGRSLAEKLKAGPLAFDELVEIAIQIALGLRAAHEAGMIHRDVKPSNVLVSASGVVKIVDFGLALLAASQDPRNRDSAGTPAYMSPEQALGAVVDHRTDLWALGVTIYQMATGELPFRGADFITIRRAMLTDFGAPNPASRTEAYERLEPIIARALARDRSDRYSSAAEMAADLKAVAAAGSHPRRESDSPRLAVLPFTNLSKQDDEYFSDGLTDEFIHALVHLDGLRVVSRSSAFEFKGKSVNIQEVGAKLNVTNVLEGSVRIAGGRLRVTAQLTNVEDGFPIWSERFDHEMKDVFQIQDEITSAIVRKLRVRLTGDDARRMQAEPKNLGAYSLYLKGKFCWNEQTEEGIRRAIEHFQRAIEMDPRLAQAHAGLAEAYALIGFHGFAPAREVFPQAKAAAGRALALDPSLPDANTAMGCVKLYYDWDWKEAERFLRRAVELNPGYAKAHYFLMLYLFMTGQFDQARECMGKALELDPCNRSYYTAAGWLEYYAKRPRVAIEKLEAAMQLDPGYPELQSALGAASEQMGLHADAIRYLSNAMEAYGNKVPIVISFLGAAYASAGQKEKAYEQLGALDRLSSGSYVPHVYRALIYMACEEKDKALDELRLAAQDRDTFLCLLNVYPGSAPLRDDPRFQQLLAEIGFPQPVG